MPKLPASRQTERLIFGISGRIGSGKTTAAQYLVRAHGFKYLRYSQVLAEWQAANPTDKARLQEVGWEVMGSGMQKDLNSRLIARIDNVSSYAIDGLRHPTDFESLEKQFPRDFHLLFINCPDALRWQRLRGRFKTFAEFQEADSHPVEQQLSVLQRRAEFTLDDSGTESGLFREIEIALRKIRRVVRQ